MTDAPKTIWVMEFDEPTSANSQGVWGTVNGLEKTPRIEYTLTSSVAAQLKAARDDALREASEWAYARFYPKNEQSDWTEFAKDRAAVAIESRQGILALITKEEQNQ